MLYTANAVTAQSRAYISPQAPQPPKNSPFPHFLMSKNLLYLAIKQHF